MRLEHVNRRAGETWEPSDSALNQHGLQDENPATVRDLRRERGDFGRAALATQNLAAVYFTKYIDPSWPQGPQDDSVIQTKLNQRLLDPKLAFGFAGDGPVVEIKSMIRSLQLASEYTLRIDDDKHTTAAGENSSLLVRNLRHVRQAPAAPADLVRFHLQSFVERHGSEILDSHFGGHGQNITEFVELAHGIIENGCDDSAMTVTWRAGVALAQTKIANKALAAFIKMEFQAHALGIVRATCETEIFLERTILGQVATYRLFHQREL